MIWFITFEFSLTALWRMDWGSCWRIQAREKGGLHQASSPENREKEPDWNMFWWRNHQLGPAKCRDKGKRQVKNDSGFSSDWVDQQWNLLLLWKDWGRWRCGVWKGSRVDGVAHVWHVLSHPSRDGVQSSGQNNVEDFSLSGELNICKL